MFPSKESGSNTCKNMWYIISSWLWSSSGFQSAQIISVRGTEMWYCVEFLKQFKGKPIELCFDEFTRAAHDEKKSMTCVRDEGSNDVEWSIVLKMQMEFHSYDIPCEKITHQQNTTTILYGIMHKFPSFGDPPYVSEDKSLIGTIPPVEDSCVTVFMLFLSEWEIWFLSHMTKICNTLVTHSGKRIKYLITRRWGSQLIHCANLSGCRMLLRSPHPHCDVQLIKHRRHMLHWTCSKNTAKKRLQ